MAEPATPPVLPILVTEAEAARLLGCSDRTVFALRKSGQLPFVRVTEKAVRYRLADLKAWARLRRERET